MSKKKTWEEKKERVTKITNTMDEAIESYFETPEQMKEYLSFMSKFYDYSPRNAALIHSQFRGANAVGSFNFWKEKGFSVNKGEKGIQVLVPNKTVPKFKDEKGKWRNVKYANEKEKKLIEKGELAKRGSKLYFGVGHVFDVSQTNATAKDLPDIFPNRWLEGKIEDYPGMMDALEKVGEHLDVTIGEPFGELGSAKGAFYYAVGKEGNGHIGLNPRNSELQNVKTLIHELAHAKLHHVKHENHFVLTDAEKEFQAEMTAFSVASYFDIDTNEYSLGYLANWTKGKEMKDKSKLLNEVRETAVEFVGTIETEVMINKELAHEQQKDYNTQMGATDTEKILKQFYAASYKFWERENGSGNISDKTSSIEELALNDVRNINTNPFSAKGEQIDVDLKEKWLIEKEKSLSEKEEKNYILMEYGSINSVVMREVKLNDIEKDILNSETFESIDTFNDQFKEQYTLVDPEKIKVPTVVIKWSEASHILKSNSIVPFKEANEKMESIIKEQNKELGYYKTRYNVLLPTGGKIDVLPLDRLDLGDGYYSSPYNQIIKEKNLTPEQQKLLNDAIAEQQKDVHWYEMTARPVSPGCQPKGFVDFDDSKGRHGVVAYDRKLSRDELEAFQMRKFQDKKELSKEQKNEMVLER